MRIAALSDFHIGATDATDCFGHSERDFLAYLDDLERDHDLIVFLGDIFHTEYGALPDRATARRQLAMARARVPRLCERMARPGYRYIHGNHDEVARQVLAAPTFLRIRADDFTLFFIHGHQYDPMLRAPLYPLSRAATWFTGRLRRVGLAPVANHLERRDVEIKHRRLGGTDGPYMRAARRLLRQHRADCVLMGHTHVPLRRVLPGGLAVNTGTCCHGQRCHVSIDTETRSVAVRDG